MKYKKVFQILMILIILFLFNQIVFAGTYIQCQMPNPLRVAVPPRYIVQSSTLFAVSPSGANYQLDTCAETSACTYTNPDIEFCNEEGQWKAKLTGPQGPTTNNAWPVNYDVYENQCVSSTCQGLSNEWASPGCCGDDRGIGGDCASVLGANQICDVTPTGGTLFADNIGDVRSITCASAQFLNDGSSWKFCGLGGVSGNIDIEWFARTTNVPKLGDRIWSGDSISASEYSAYQSEQHATLPSDDLGVVTGFGLSVNSPFSVSKLALEIRKLNNCDLDFASNFVPVNSQDNFNNLQKTLIVPKGYVVTGIGINLTDGSSDFVFDKLELQNRSSVCLLGPPEILGDANLDIKSVDNSILTGFGAISYRGAYSNTGDIILRTNKIINAGTGNTISIDAGGTPIGSQIDTAQLDLPNVDYVLSTSSPLVKISFAPDSEVLTFNNVAPQTIPIYLRSISPISGNNSDFTVLQVNNNGYLCSSTGIIECCGTDLANCQGTDETPMLSSEPPVLVGDQLFYCLDDGSFDANLDGKENECKNAGFIWTGTKCCSEGDDPNEYYNEPIEFTNPNQFGSCWNKTFVRSGYFPSISGVDLKTVTNYNGSFYGCNADSKELAILDYHTNTQLVTPMPTCTVLPNAQTSLNPHLVCSPEGKWLGVKDVNSQALKNLAWTDPNVDQSACCASSQCWDGLSCIDDMSQDSIIKPINGLRCINGDWTDAISKKSWNESESGFCAQKSDCLVDAGGDGAFNYQPEKYFSLSNKKPACIADGQHILDFACEGGNWTTRTKQIGETMLNFLQVAGKENDFTFVCGKYSETLNEFNSIKNLLESCTVGESKEDCVNNFCVLQYGQETGVGISLNTPIESDSSFLQVLNKGGDFCKPYINDGKFHRCGVSSNPSIWFNNQTNSLIYLTSNQDLYSTGGLDLFKQFVKNPFATIRNFVFSKLHEQPSSWEFFDDTRIFNRMFASKKGTKELFAFLEENQALAPVPGTEFRDYLGIKYDGVNIDVCEFITQYDNKASCDNSGGVYNIASSRIGEDSALADAWTDLTSKLRP